MDRNQWMYEIRHDTIKCLRGAEKFIDHATQDMSQRGDQIILCPCWDCQNL
jgi:Transposase-associated domain